MAKLVLITGGARSGKSSYALGVAEKISKKKLFIATCPQLDSEMSERVKRHKEERSGKGWRTIEEEIDLANIFPAKVNDVDVVVIDCITLWVNNVLYTLGEENVNDHKIGELCRIWLRKITEYHGTVLCVTNEVGMGVVPDNRLARKYRDLVGTCNQLLGKMADEIVLVCCGVPLFIKSSGK